MTNEEQKRKLRNLKNVLTRRARYVPVPSRYECKGGPFDGEFLFLQSGSTCHLVIGGWRGRYTSVSDQGYYHTASNGPTVAWEGDHAAH